MKKLIYVMLSLAVLFSCRKETSQLSQDSLLISKANLYLKNNLSESDFSRLDLSKSFFTKYENNITTFRVAFAGRPISQDFIALKLINSEITNAAIIELSETRDEITNQRSFNGFITIKTLDRKQNFSSEIKNGFITKWLKNIGTSQGRTDVVPDPHVDLPVVVVVGHKSSGGGGISWSTYMNLLSFFNTFDGSGGGGTSNYYQSLDFMGGGGGGGYGPTPIKIDFENQFADPAIDLKAYMKCFTDIPDEGATGSIELFTDLPVNGEPNTFFDWESGSPGHTFIQLRKQNGSQSVSQNIGFYPVQGWKTPLTPAPIEGKFVDNQHHEYNASIKINLNSNQINSAVTEILYLVNFLRYDIDEYNCTDWAMEIYNKIVQTEQKLEIPMYDLPGAQAPFGSSTPQGLYQKLKELKDAGGPLAGNIDIPLVGFVGASSGPCK